MLKMIIVDVHGLVDGVLYIPSMDKAREICNRELDGYSMGVIDGSYLMKNSGDPLNDDNNYYDRPLFKSSSRDVALMALRV